MSALSKVDALAVALFEANARNAGHDPADHFDRSAGVQWMRMALTECGVAELVDAAMAYYAVDPHSFNSLDDDEYEAAHDAGDRLQGALARIGEQA